MTDGRPSPAVQLCRSAAPECTELCDPERRAVTGAERSGGLSYALEAACGTVTLHRSHDLQSSEALYLSDAKQLKPWLHEQELDPSAFDEELGLKVVSQKIAAGPLTR